VYAHKVKFDWKPTFFNCYLFLQWEDGDLVVIDNQQIAHLASKESQLPRERVGLRILHRLSVTGFERPTKKEPVVIVWTICYSQKFF
jgi:alpha-ketoglutarate-dependent taurine dioxygenase